MRVCIPYRQGFAYIDSINEVNIKYENEYYEDLISFISASPYNSKRINLEIIDIYAFAEDSNIKLFKNIKEKYNFDIAFVFSDPFDLGVIEAINKIKEYKITYPYFFKTVACKWDQLIGLAGAGASEVYIGEDLGFEIIDVSKFAKAANIKIRVYPNIAQSSWEIKEGESLKSFFIRPEDVDMYEPYVDTIEFYGKSRTETYFRIYMEDKKWVGDLKDLIIGLKESIPNDCLVGNVENRLNCGKHCIKKNNCNICDNLLSLAKSLKENNLYIGQIKEES